MMDLQAAIGIHQLKRVRRNWIRRQGIWKYYQQAFTDLPVTCPAEPEPNTKHGYHLYTLLIDKDRTGMNRDIFLNEMTKQNIGVGVHYLSTPEHPYYQKAFGWKPEGYPNAMCVGRQTVSLPLSAKMLEEDVADVVNSVQAVLKQ